MQKLGALLACVPVIAACGASSISLRLRGDIAARNLGGGPVLVGQPADYTAFLQNSSRVSVSLDSVVLLPMRGYPSPRLVHAAVESGREIAFMVAGWPPAGGNYELRPLRGYNVGPGKRVAIMYSVVGLTVGDYVARGVRLTVWHRGGRASVDLLSASLTCVAEVRPRPCPPAVIARVQSVVERLKR